MSTEKNQGIGFFEKYLTLWVVICMAVGVLIGKYLPVVPEFLGKFEYANVSIPIAVLIWLMIYPMMMKVDFKSIKNVGKNPAGLFVTWVVNWLIKPFTMFAIASFFFFVVFKGLISPELAKDYLFTTTFFRQENLILPELTMDTLPAGQYFLRVRATNASGYTQDAFDYYVTEAGKHYGMLCFYVQPDGSIVEDTYEE